MGEENIKTAGLVIIGDEILSGRTKDKNIGHIADFLTNFGVELCEVRVVQDSEQHIVEAVNALRSRYSYVFTTGGIGPTHDDITADAIAKAFDVPIDIDERAVAMMRSRFGDDQMTQARMRMARIPKGAELIENTISNTPGFKLENVFVLAGIPRIMQVMLDAAAQMMERGKPILSRTIRVERVESEVAAGLRQLQDAYADVQMGSYPFFEDGILGTNLVLRGRDEKRLDLALAALDGMLSELD